MPEHGQCVCVVCGVCLYACVQFVGARMCVVCVFLDGDVLGGGSCKASKVVSAFHHVWLSSRLVAISVRVLPREGCVWWVLSSKCMGEQRNNSTFEFLPVSINALIAIPAAVCPHLSAAVCVCVCTCCVVW